MNPVGEHHRFDRRYHLKGVAGSWVIHRIYSEGRGGQKRLPSTTVTIWGETSRISQLGSSSEEAAVRV